MGASKCSICKKTINNEKYNLQKSCTTHTNSLLKDFVEKIIKRAVVVNGDTSVCNKCFKLLNDFDYANKTCEHIRKKVLSYFGLKSTTVNVYCQTDNPLVNIIGYDIHNNRKNGKFKKQQLLKSKVDCTKCGQEFATEDELQTHMDIHKEQPKFKCDICQKLFTSKAGLEIHINNYHVVISEAPVQILTDINKGCRTISNFVQKPTDFSESTFSNQLIVNSIGYENILGEPCSEIIIQSSNDNCVSDFSMGIGNVVDGDEIVEEKCDSNMDEKNVSELQIKEKEINLKNDDNIIDDAQETKLLTNGEIQKNSAKRPGRKKKYPDVERPYLCTECPKTWKTSNELKNHLLSHTVVKPFICEICGQSYKHKQALRIHVGMHKGIFPFTCQYCKKSFTQKAALQRHIPIHTGETPFICDQCGKGFVHHTSFHVHKLSHSGEKKYKCTLCGLALMSTSHLRRHLKIHTKEKNHSCSVCGKRFAERYNLATHQKIHETTPNASNNTIMQKTYKCHLCDLSFERRIKLEEHMVHKHQAVRDIDVQALENIFVKTDNRVVKIEDHFMLNVPNPPIGLM